MPLNWVNRDGKIIILARSTRTFAQGSIAVLFAVYLDLLGFTLTQIGIFFSFGVAGAALFSFLVSLIAEKVGRRTWLCNNEPHRRQHFGGAPKAHTQGLPQGDSPHCDCRRRNNYPVHGDLARNKSGS